MPKTLHTLFFSLLLILLAIPAHALTPNDTLLGNQWYLETIRAYEAWDVTTGSSDVVIAVLDTGVDVDHPDLAGNIWVNSREIAGDGIDNDLNGFVDDVNGWDFTENDNSPYPSLFRGAEVSPDAVSHGTIVAGEIGAIGNNAEGIAGLSWKGKIMPVRILDNLGSGDSGAAVEAVKYAVNNGADVINLSFTGFTYSEEFRNAIAMAHGAGVTVVAALGNQNGGGVDIDATPIYPACFKADDGTDLVIGVAASGEADEKADFSNFGSSCADLAAPGVDIFGTVYNDDEWEVFADSYGGWWAGTSMAAPLVSGTIALLKARFPTLTPDQVKTVLQLSVDPIKDSAFAGKLGAGRVNVARALEIANNFAEPVASGSLSPELVEGATSSPSTGSGSNSNHIVVTAAAGSNPTVWVFDKHGNLQTSFDAYAPTFRGGVRAATFDIDGDGAEEIVTVPGPAGGPHVRIFDLQGNLEGQFFAFEKELRSGLFVSSADIDGDFLREVVISTDAGGNGRVAMFERNGERLSSFLPYGQTDVAVRVAGGNLDGVGADEVIASTGPSTKPEVRTFDGTGSLRAEFLAYAPTYYNGVYVSVGDLNGDGIDEIVTGTDSGGGPHVRAFTEQGSVVASFFAYDPGFRGGVRVGVKRLNGTASIITAAGPGGGPHVRVFNQAGEAIGGFFAENESNRNGIYIAGE